MKAKAYIAIVISGLVLLAATILVILQWGNRTVFSLFGKNYGANANAEGGLNTALVILGSAVGGVVAWYLLRALFWGVRALHRVRRDERRRETEFRKVQAKVERQGVPPAAAPVDEQTPES